MVTVRIKFGVVEIEYEVEDEYLNGGIKTLVKDLHAIGSPLTDEHTSGKIRPSISMMKNAKGEAHSASTSTQKPGEDSGPDIILAAAMRLTLTGLFKFTKSQIRREILDARAFYGSRYSSNFEVDLKALLGMGRITHVVGETYSLSAKDQARLIARTTSAAGATSAEASLLN